MNLPKHCSMQATSSLKLQFLLFPDQKVPNWKLNKIPEMEVTK